MPGTRVPVPLSTTRPVPSGSPQTCRHLEGTCPPAPTQPQTPASGPLERGALTCREACCGAAPWSRRGSWPADGAGCPARESPAPIAALRLLGPLNPRAAGRERPCARPRASGPPGLVRDVEAGASTRVAAARRGGGGEDTVGQASTGVGGEGAAPLPL